MTAASNSRRPALLCALTLLVCALATYPVAEIGMNDDWSYVQSARILAQTGHIVYNGWSAPILGWQLYLSAFFVHFFGPSYTAIRASTLLIALITAFLTQRTFVRAGINSRNANIGTLSLVLSPLFLPLAVIFMTDVDSLFCIVLCLYGCLRALEAQTDRAVLAWLAFAALSNALGGTVRQIAWLGVLVIFPCTVWLLRRRPHVLLAGALLYAISILIIFTTLHWFLQQPYSLPERIFEGFPGRQQLIRAVVDVPSFCLSFALFLLPVLVAFIPATPLRNRRAASCLAVGGVLCAAAGLFLVLRLPGRVDRFLAPFRGGYVTRFGLVDRFPIKGRGPVVLVLGPRLLITFVVLLAILCLLAFLLANCRHDRPAQTAPSPASWPTLLVLLVPFALAYLALLLPRAFRGFLFDRYLLLLLPIGLIILLRLYQDRVQPDLPLVSNVFVLLFAIYAVAGTHDAFSMYRARQAAVQQLRAAGIPDTSIDAGFEHNGMAQIERVGYINSPDIRLPAEAKLTMPTSFPIDCQPRWVTLTPAIVPGYALSYDPTACGGLSRFAPVTYTSWLGPRTSTVYIVNTAKPAPTQP